MPTDTPHSVLAHRDLHLGPLNRQRYKRISLSQRGFTLLELLIVIALIGILATIAVPNFQEMVKRNAVVSQNNELVALINTAKSEAVRRSTAVTISIVAAGTDSWRAQLQDPDTVGIFLRETSNPSVILNGPETFTFNSRGYLGVDGELGDEVALSLTHINCTSQGQHRTIKILPTGQLVGSSNACPT